MLIHCKNCKNEYRGNFCNECGQSAAVGRLSSRHIFDDLINHVLNLEKGILFTFVELTMRPAQVLRDYLQGRRATYYHPLKYLLLLTSIWVSIVLFSDVLEPYYREFFPKQYSSAASKSFADTVTKFLHRMMEYMTLIQVFYVPFTAVASRWLFRKAQLNFAEHLALNSYLVGHVVVFSLLSLPFHLVLSVSSAGYVMVGLSMVSFVWKGMVYHEFFKVSWWRAMAAPFVAYMLYITVMFLSGFLLALIYFKWIKYVVN